MAVAYQCTECKHNIGPQWTASMQPREFICPVTKRVATHEETRYAVRDT